MNTSVSPSASPPDATPVDPQGVKEDAIRNGAMAAGQTPLDPSTPTPGAAEKGERICDAPSDPHKPAGVESVDKGA